MGQVHTQQSKPVVAILYQKLELPDLVHNVEGYIASLKQQIMTDGMAIEMELMEDDDLALLLIALATLHKISPEAIFTTNSGQQILIYDNQTKPVIRDEEIDSRYIRYTDSKYERQRDGDATIDLENIYNSITENDWNEKITDALLEFRAQLKPVNKLLIYGKEPKLLFLLALMCTYGVVNEVYYQADKNSEQIKVR